MSFCFLVTYKCDGKQQNVDNGQSKASLEHSTALIDMQLRTKEADLAEIEIRRCATKVGAICFCNVAQIVDTGDECANEAGIDKRQKAAGMTNATVQDGGKDDPGEPERRDDEQDQDVVRRKLVSLGKGMHEPREHADDGHQRDELVEAP